MIAFEPPRRRQAFTWGSSTRDGCVSNRLHGVIRHALRAWSSGQETRVFLCKKPLGTTRKDRSSHESTTSPSHEGRVPDDHPSVRA